MKNTKYSRDAGEFFSWPKNGTLINISAKEKGTVLLPCIAVHVFRHLLWWHLLLGEVGKFLLDGRVEKLFLQALDRDGEVEQ